MSLSEIRSRIISKHSNSVHQLTLDAGSINTFYLHSGKGRAVIFLHGAGGGGLVWLPLLHVVAREFEVFIPDMPGYGESDKPQAAYDKVFFSRWLFDFFNAAGIKSASIVANSMGGAVALQFTMDHPQMVEKLVLAGSCGFGLEGMSKKAFFHMMLSNIFPSPKTIKGLLNYLFYNKNLLPGMDQQAYFLEVIKSPGGKQAFARGKGKAVQAFPHKSLQKIKQPVLLIWGSHDRIVPVINAEKGGLLLADSRLEIIDGTGHVPFVEKPGDFLKLALPFLREKAAPDFEIN